MVVAVNDLELLRKATLEALKEGEGTASLIYADALEELNEGGTGVLQGLGPTGTTVPRLDLPPLVGQGIGKPRVVVFRNTGQLLHSKGRSRCPSSLRPTTRENREPVVGGRRTVGGPDGQIEGTL